MANLKLQFLAEIARKKRTRPKHRRLATQTIATNTRLKTLIRFFRITISTMPFLTRLERIERCECSFSIGVILVKNGDGLGG